MIRFWIAYAVSAMVAIAVAIVLRRRDWLAAAIFAVLYMVPALLIAFSVPRMKWKVVAGILVALLGFLWTAGILPVIYDRLEQVFYPQ